MCGGQVRHGEGGIGICNLFLVGRRAESDEVLLMSQLWPVINGSEGDNNMIGGMVNLGPAGLGNRLSVPAERGRQCSLRNLLVLL